MPYRAFEIDGEYCVYRLDEDGERTGETLGCHDTKAEADAQVKALYANEPEASEQEPGGPDLCVCPECDYSEEKVRGVPCRSVDCPECGTALVAGEGEQEEADVNELKAAAGELKEYAYDFATLRTQQATNNAIAEVDTLTYQFRDIATNILYSIDVSDKVAALQALADEYIDLVAEALGGIGESEPEPEFEECELAESNTGSIVAVRESQSIEDDEPDPLELDIVVIEPGWGNSKDNHYYSAEMLAAHAGAFGGAKMYATNHKADEKNVLTEVSQVLECPVGFTETGAPIARVGVFDNAFAESIRNRAALGKLEDLHVSILANGTARAYEENGRKGKYVETISSGAGVDWVTRAGAGGHALRLAENQEAIMKPEEILEEEIQEEETEVVEQQEPEPAEIEPVAETEPEPVVLSESEVEQALGESKLPDASRARLAEGEYENAEQLETAIEAERAYVVALTGAGRPVGQQAARDAAQSARMTEEERLAKYEAKLNRIDRDHGVYREIE